MKETFARQQISHLLSKLMKDSWILIDMNISDVYKFRLQGIYGLHKPSSCNEFSEGYRFDANLLLWSKRIEAWWRIYASISLVNIGSDNGFPLGQLEAINCTNTDLLSIGPPGSHC